MIAANCKLKIPTSVEVVSGERGIFIPGVSALLGAAYIVASREDDG